MYFIYNLLLLGAALFLVPYYGARLLFTGKYRRSLGQKFGFLPCLPKTAPGAFRIWFHAVSVGEVAAAKPIVAAMREILPQGTIFFSTGTETGQEMARKTIPAAFHFYYPLDLPWVVKRVLTQLDPDIFVTTETELWPNFSRLCFRRGVRMVIVNGRLSPSSFRYYRLGWFFWRRVLSSFSAVGAISEEHADRFRLLGLAREKIRVLGNAKYDNLFPQDRTERLLYWSEKIKGKTERPVWVAGSTHEGEEEIILGVFLKLRKDYPSLLLVLAPRNMERVRLVGKMIVEAGWADCLALKDLENGRGPASSVILVDRIGELYHLYGLAQVVFCGGSLVAKGGQNILEPAAWGKPVFFGPHMEDFPGEAEELGKSGAGVMVRDKEDLYLGLLALLADEEKNALLGQRAQEVVKKRSGAAGRYATLVQEVIESAGACDSKPS